MKILRHTFIFSGYWSCVRGKYSPHHCYSIYTIKLEINRLESDPCWNYTSGEMSWQQCIAGLRGTPFVSPKQTHFVLFTQYYEYLWGLYVNYSEFETGSWNFLKCKIYNRSPKHYPVRQTINFKAIKSQFWQNREILKYEILTAL